MYICVAMSTTIMLYRSCIKVTSKIHRMPTWEEQGICIGSSFQLAATNGHDPARRINIEGFCQSVDYLFESIEDTVRQQRGEILLEERELKGGLHEILKLTVAVPFLWGVPPQLDMLRWWDNMYTCMEQPDSINIHARVYGIGLKRVLLKKTAFFYWHPLICMGEGGLQNKIFC